MSPDVAKLTPNHAQILETVREWGVIDREQITALCARDNFSPEGIRTALGRMVNDDLLSSDLRNAHHPKADIGLAAKRTIYYLAERGRTYFNFQPEDRKRLTNRIKKYVYTPAKLPHDVGVSWVHTVFALGHRHLLWDLDWRQGQNAAIISNGKRHTPDGIAQVTTFAPFTRFIEYEHRNKGEKTLSHARFYWNALKDKAIDGRVIWVGRSQEKLRALRAAIVSEVPDARSLFVFVSQDQFDLRHAERLVEPMFQTAGEHLAPVIPGRKDGEPLG